MTITTLEAERAVPEHEDDLLGGLTPEAWDRLAGDEFYSTARWLAFVALHGGGKPGAAVARTDGEPVAVVPFTELAAPPPPLYRWHDVLTGHGLPAPEPGGLLVGPRQGYRTRLLLRRGADRTAAAARLVAELRERAAGGSCVAMYLPTEDARALVEAGVTAPPVLLEADASFELPPGGWEGWLASLPARRRRGIRVEVRRFEKAGYRIERRPLADCYELLPALAGSTLAKYGHAAPDSDWLALLQLHLAGMGEAARVALCLRGDEDPVGFVLYYVWGETLYGRWHGFDYARLVDGAAEYFNLAYYSSVAAAPELGVRRIHVGIKSPEAKAMRGADLRPLWLVALAEESPLARERDAVLAHNRGVYERLAADERIRNALVDADTWTAFS